MQITGGRASSAPTINSLVYAWYEGATGRVDQRKIRFDKMVKYRKIPAVGLGKKTPERGVKHHRRATWVNAQEEVIEFDEDIDIDRFGNVESELKAINIVKVVDAGELDGGDNIEEKVNAGELDGGDVDREVDVSMVENVSATMTDNCEKCGSGIPKVGDKFRWIDIDDDPCVACAFRWNQLSTTSCRCGPAAGSSSTRSVDWGGL